jgi:hypothetical protein
VTRGGKIRVIDALIQFMSQIGNIKTTHAESLCLGAIAENVQKIQQLKSATGDGGMS